MDKNITRQLRVIGTPAEIYSFEEVAKLYGNFEGMQEGHIRHIIQGILDNLNVNLKNLTVLYDGNSVYSKEKIIKSFKRLVKNYTFDNFSDTLYKFFSLACGSIAHYNRMGWFDIYDTPDKLKAFIKRNEYGQDIVNYQPHWAVDRIAITKEMAKLMKVRI
jgi:hypothetical protein